MSERLSSVEIEDVLSSIRRLVSEDLRPGAKPAEAAAPVAPPVAAPAAEVGKLVLTPAHRIAPEPAEPMGGFASVRGRAGAASAYEEDAEVPAAGPTAGHDWFDFAAPGADGGEGSVAEGAASAAESEAPATVADADEAAWAEPAVTEAVLESEPEDVLSGPAAQAEGADWLPEDELADAPTADAAEEAPMADVLDPEEAVTVEPKPETVVEEDWADAAEAEIRRELEEEAEASVFTRFDAAADIDDPAEPVFDEEMLRDLVRDIIREELQGALGERITRNVRKLVRAEIARALAVRDFE